MFLTLKPVTSHIKYAPSPSPTGTAVASDVEAEDICVGSIPDENTRPFMTQLSAVKLPPLTCLHIIEETALVPDDHSVLTTS